LTLAEKIEELQPFGMGNPQPIFYSEAEVVGTKLFGKKSEYLKIFVKDPTKFTFPMELITFSPTPEMKEVTKGQKINVIYNLEVDRWEGSNKVRGRCLHLIPNQS
ncbi:MAG: hypothetical protein Q7S61_00770, partial [bacterium]|nr:hypothetical protein [bacterium]